MKKWLYDILLSIEEIEGYVLSCKGDYEMFSQSLITCRAMERSFEIIGEAMNRIYKVHPDLELTEMSGYIGMRNIISHGYEVVSYRNLWKTAVEDLPVLKQEVEQLLNS